MELIKILEENGVMPAAALNPSRIEEPFKKRFYYC